MSGLRRLFHPRSDEENAQQPGHSPRENGVRFRNRLLQPISLLHEHLWIPHDSRPGTRRSQPAEGSPVPICKSGSSPATATACPSAAIT